ncbi:MAG: flagellin [Phycisphaeraceae bacterium]|nr:flagellin [Phycisphaerales bacterium]MCB9861458.1 flagellin [Phycisphaeraceae bacterium]
MSRINSNIPSMTAQVNLAQNNRDLDVRLQRLATGLRINRGADDPAGLIVSERLRSDIRGAEQGIKNSERASSVIATTEGAISEINELLNSIRSLVVEAANTGAFSKEEREANQLQIDSAIDSITRIANTANFGGLKLLNGERDYQLSGLATSAISHAKILGASFIGGSSVPVEVDVLASAQTGALYLRGDLPTPGAGGNGTVLSTTTIRVQGPEGVQEFQFLSGTAYSKIAQAINDTSQLTGVKAELLNGNAASGIRFHTENYGSDAMVSVERVGGPSTPSADWWATYKLDDSAAVASGAPFPWASYTITANSDKGRNVQALVNGNLATGDGLKIKTRTPTLSMDLLLHEDLATDPSATASTFTVTGGGSLFQLGPEVNASQQSSIGVPATSASQLGATLVNGELQFLSSLKSGAGNSLKELSDRGDFTGASKILENSIDEVTVVRGRLGAFERNVLEPNIRSLQTSVENLSASESRIRDADFAYETSKLTRAQILSSAATSTLALANQQSQQVLQLLG